MLAIGASRQAYTEARQAYTVPEAAALFGATHQAMYRAAARGEIHSIRIGKRIYLSRADVDQLVARLSDARQCGQTPAQMLVALSEQASRASTLPTARGEVAIDP